MDPKSWAAAISQVGPNYAIIFALLAMLGFLAFKGVPAVLELTRAIQQNTDSVTAITKGQEINQTVVVQNQSRIIDNESNMIEQHGKIISLMVNREAVLNLEEQTCLNTAKSPYQQRRCMEIRNGAGASP